MSRDLSAKDAKKREGSFVGNTLRGVPRPATELATRGEEIYPLKTRRISCSLTKRRRERREEIFVGWVEGAGLQASRQRVNSPGTHQKLGAKESLVG